MPDESTSPPSGVPGPGPSAPIDPAARIGTVIGGKYRIIDRLGTGGMARIYRAEQLPLGRIVALKELIPRGPDEEVEDSFYQRFFLEASTLSRLTHPNTVRVFDYGQHEDGAFYMVMELVEGQTLAEVIDGGGPLPPVRAVHIAMEICRSLHEAHGHQVVHRDLKPANVMLLRTSEGEAVKVLDFGIAKVLHEERQEITVDDRIVGSPRYMAPEQIRNEALGPPTDIYALGVMLFEMLTGRPPYRAATTIQTLMAHIHDPIPSVARHSPHPLPEALQAVVTACLAKKPTARPQRVEDLREALREVLVELASATTVDRLRTDITIREALERSTGEGPSVPLTEAPPPTLELEASPRGSAPVRGGLWVAGLAFLGSLSAVVGLGLLWNGMRYGEEAPEEVVEVAMPAEVRLDSDPPGAEVWEANRLHGRTPMVLPQEGDEVRHLVLRLDGYRPAALTVGPEDAQRQATLEALEVAAPGSPPAQEGSQAPAPAAAPPDTPAPPPKRPPRVDEGLDILMER